MAIVVEDGSGLSAAQTYVSVANADDYHSVRGNAAWTGTEAVKEAALIKAAQYLDGHYRNRWKGFRRLREQSLAWPRYDVLDADGWDVDSDAVPAQVVSACCEAALRSLSADLSPDLARGGAVKSKTVGPISVTYADGASSKTKYSTVDDLLSGLIVPGGKLIRG